MGKIHTVIYSDTGPTAGSAVYPSITVPGTKLLCTRVNTLSEGLLKNLIVTQTSGSSVAYKVELLTSKIPYPVGNAPVATGPVGTIDLYRVVSQQSATAGNTVNLYPDNAFGYPYRNADGDHTMNQRYLYLVILPTAAAGDTKWDVLIEVESNNDGSY